MLGAAFLILASPVYAPQLLAFPYKAETSIGTVWSEHPLDGEFLAEIAADTKSRLAKTPLASANEKRPIFLTDGGWRWQWLSIPNGNSFAITRPLSRAVVTNRIEPGGASILNGRAIGGERALSAVLTHEFAHRLIWRRFGVVAAASFPQWKVEGYCDYVAGESSLSEADVAKLEETGADHPALPDFHGRRRVAAMLAANGGDVDALFGKTD